MRNVVIIGASHAAVEAISTLRKNAWEGSITLIGDEPGLPYKRPPLTKGYYRGELSAEKLAIKAPSFYQTANVDLRLNERAVAIDRAASKVTIESGQEVAYSDLIIATGARAKHLKVKGADLPCIRYLRTVSDVDSIKGDLNPGAKLLIVGGGYIGLELAASIVHQGIDVVVLEGKDRVLARVTSPEISSFYQQLHKENGVDIRLAASLDRIQSEGGKNVAIMADGEEVEFDCAVVGIGVLPNEDLAKGAGLKCSDGIIVDEFTRTSDPRIYAVGDCSNHPSRIYQRRLRLESVPNAVAQAKTAAMAICGKDIAYNQLPWFWSDQYDVKLQTAGILEGYDEAIISGDVEAREFSVSYYLHGKLIALDALNCPAQFIKAKREISGL